MVIILCEDDDDDFLTMREIQHEGVKAALRKTKGNNTEAAKLLGVSRSTLYRLLNEMLLGDEPAEKLSSTRAPSVEFEIRKAA